MSEFVPAISTYFIKIGTTTLDNAYIAYSSYRANCVQVSAGKVRNANGVEVENFYPAEKLTVSFKTCNMTEEMLEEFAEMLLTEMNGHEYVEVKAWVPKKNNYVTQICKVDGIEPILNCLSKRHIAIYNGFNLTLNGYGGVPND